EGEEGCCPLRPMSGGRRWKGSGGMPRL
ncbi:ubiquitin specific peptidase 15, partial [Nannochloropsis oceanica]